MTTITRLNGNTVLLGDIHGNTHLVDQFIESCNINANVVSNVILMGDIGIGFGKLINGKDTTLISLSRVADNHRVKIYIILGNHDNRRLMESQFIVEPDGAGMIATTDVYPGLAWLTDGSVVHMSDRNWLVWGGAVSVDKHRRTEGRNWWSTETRTDYDSFNIIEDVFHDVKHERLLIEGLLCHDVPESTVHKCTVPGYVPPFTTQALLDEARVHSRLIDHIIDTFHINHVVHGHMHTFYSHVNYDKFLSVVGLGNTDTQSGQKFWLFDKEI